VLADYRTASIDERLRATLAFLEKMTLTPDALGPEDARRVRDAGVSDEALWDAVHVAVAFNTITRIADGLGFAIPTAAQFRSMAKMLLRIGYD